MNTVELQRLAKMASIGEAVVKLVNGDKPARVRKAASGAKRRGRPKGSKNKTAVVANGDAPLADHIDE